MHKKIIRFYALGAYDTMGKTIQLTSILIARNGFRTTIVFFLYSSLNPLVTRCTKLQYRAITD